MDALKMSFSLTCHVAIYYKRNGHWFIFYELKPKSPVGKSCVFFTYPSNATTYLQYLNPQMFV